MYKIFKQIIYRLLTLFIGINKHLSWHFYILTCKEVKIVVGAGPTKYREWFSTDIVTLDITKEYDFIKYFSKKKIKNILAEHVIEHLAYNDFIKFLQITKKYLKKGGIIRIAVPDKFHPSQYVRELTGVQGLEPGADDHKYFYGIDDLEKIAVENSFLIDKIEYFDEKGFFHTKSFNYDNGYISRCSKNYKGRFTENKEEYFKMISTVPFGLKEQFEKYNISYTSLLVDFINP